MTDPSSQQPAAGQPAAPDEFGARPRPAPPRTPVMPPVMQPEVPGVPPVVQPAVVPPPVAASPAKEYSATIVAPSQIAISVGIGVLLAVVLVGIRTSLWPFAIIVFVAVGGVGVYLAGVSVLATPTHIELGQGRFEREPRYIAADEIVTASAADYTWAQVFGVGLPRAERVTRLTVRPGPTLVLDLRNGETVRVSTPEPLQAMAVLARPTA